MPRFELGLQGEKRERFLRAMLLTYGPRTAKKSHQRSEMPVPETPSSVFRPRSDEILRDVGVQVERFLGRRVAQVAVERLADLAQGQEVNGLKLDLGSDGRRMLGARDCVVRLENQKFELVITDTNTSSILGVYTV